jgi:DNA-binding CsgD family transcriptional regulator
VEFGRLLVLAVFGVSAVVFTALAVQAARRARHQLRPIRVLLHLIAALAVTYATGSIMLVVGELARIGLLPPEVGEVATGPGWLAFGIAVTVLLAVATSQFLPVWRHLRHIDATVEAMVPEASYDIAASELALTAREAEVLGAIFDGALSDEEISERLFVTRSTISSHITNLMKKTGAKTRRELLLIVSRKER